MLLIKQYPLLDKEEELKLAIQFHEHGDVEAAKKLVCANLRLVVKIAMEYKGAYENLLDLIQEGNIGLMKAVSKFDPSKNVRLSYFAGFWIRSYICKYLSGNFRLIKSSRSEDDRWDRPKELSLDHTELLKLTDNSFKQHDELELDQLKNIVRDGLPKFLQVLDDRELVIFRHRIMTDDPKTLQEVGDKLDLTRERVRQIESSVIDKLKEYYVFIRD